MGLTLIGQSKWEGDAHDGAQMHLRRNLNGVCIKQCSSQNGVLGAHTGRSPELQNINHLSVGPQQRICNS